MTTSPDRIQQLIASSRRVISAAALDNGAIVAANVDQPSPSRQGQTKNLNHSFNAPADYRSVWPRDGSFAALAGEKLGLPIADKFFRWLRDKPEDFQKDGLLFANYAPSGRIGSLGRLFEPDQMGTVLWAISMHCGQDHQRAEDHRELIERLSNGLVTAWNKTYFLPNTVDLWEEEYRQTSTRAENAFTYSLAACGRGLLSAHRLYPNKLWKQTAAQMEKKMKAAYDDHRRYFLRSRGKVEDPSIDASMLGLVWPFAMAEPNDPRMISTIGAIERELVHGGGIHRFQYDYPDVEGSATEGGGAWPVLNFWMAIVLHHSGEKERAAAYFYWVLAHCQTYIPEQIFADHRRAISPLVWSHAMFVLAADELGIKLDE